MVKKILFILHLFIAVISFSQEKPIETIYAVPNPFIDSTKIIYHTTKTETIIFSVKNILGKVVFKQNFKAKKGKNSIPFSKRNLLAGMYIYTVQNINTTISKRLVIK